MGASGSNFFLIPLNRELNILNGGLLPISTLTEYAVFFLSFTLNDGSGGK